MTHQSLSCAAFLGRRDWRHPTGGIEFGEYPTMRRSKGVVCSG